MEDYNIDMNRLNEILKSRELRAKKQQSLLLEYPYTLISFTLNIPGSVKNSYLYGRIHEEGMNCLLKILQEKKIHVVNTEKFNKNTGGEGFISIDLDAVQAKKITVNLEDCHPLGRIFDIDVFDKNHNQISRSNLNLKSRRCMLCHEEAIKCIKKKSHSYEELISKIEELGNAYFKSKSYK